MEPPLPERRERRCPACQGEAVTPTDPLLTINDPATKETKEKLRCTACETQFWWVRTD